MPLRACVLATIGMLTLTVSAAPNLFQKETPTVRITWRDAHWTFHSGQAVELTLEIYNDSKSADPIDVEWSLQSGGKAYAEGAETFAIQPGSSEKYTINFRVPPFPGQAKGQLVLSCLRAGQEILHVEKPCVLGETSAEALPTPKANSDACPPTPESPLPQLPGTDRESLPASQSRRLFPGLHLRALPGFRRTSPRIP
jgi:hypothetical protein